MSKEQWTWDDWKSLFDMNFSISMDQLIQGPEDELTEEHDPESSSPALNKTLDAGNTFNLFQTPGPGARANIGDIWYMPLIGYRRLPRYLTALTVLPDSHKPIKQDHHEYWRATGAFVSQFISNYRGLQEFGREAPLKGDLNIDILRDLCILLQLLESRTIGKSFEQYYLLYTDNPSPSDLDYTWMRMGTYCYQMGSVYSSAILEGLLRRRSSVLTSNGKPKDADEIGQDKLERTKALMNQNRAYLFDALRLWLEFDADDEVKRTVIEIEDLGGSQYTPSDEPISRRYYLGEELPEQTPADLLNTNKNIDQKVEDLIPKSGFFYDLREARNVAAHREGFVRSMCSVITSLSCLVFWDAIDEPTFGNLRDFMSASKRQKTSENPHNWLVDRKGSDFTPECFYGPWLRTLI